MAWFYHFCQGETQVKVARGTGLRRNSMLAKQYFKYYCQYLKYWRERRARTILGGNIKILLRRHQLSAAQRSFLHTSSLHHRIAVCRAVVFSSFSLILQVVVLALLLLLMVGCIIICHIFLRCTHSLILQEPQHHTARAIKLGYSQLSSPAWPVQRPL